MLCKWFSHVPTHVNYCMYPIFSLDCSSNCFCSSCVYLHVIIKCYRNASYIGLKMVPKLLSQISHTCSRTSVCLTSWNRDLFDIWCGCHLSSLLQGRKWHADSWGTRWPETEQGRKSRFWATTFNLLWIEKEICGRWVRVHNRGVKIVRSYFICHNTVCFSLQLILCNKGKIWLIWNDLISRELG